MTKTAPENQLYFEILMRSPKHREFQSEFARKYASLGKAEGKAESVSLSSKPEE